MSGRNPIIVFVQDPKKNKGGGQHIAVQYSLCSIKAQFEIISPFLRVEILKYERIWIEVMDQRTESQTIVPTTGEVRDLYCLEINCKKCEPAYF